MQLGLIIEASDPERIWNGFRLTNTALDADHAVDIFLLCDGVEAPDSRTRSSPPAESSGST